MEEVEEALASELQALIFVGVLRPWPWMSYLREIRMDDARADQRERLFGCTEAFGLTPYIGS